VGPLAAVGLTSKSRTDHGPTEDLEPLYQKGLEHTILRMTEIFLPYGSPPLQQSHPLQWQKSGLCRLAVLVMVAAKVC
jgi:hypothetical protein